MPIRQNILRKGKAPKQNLLKFDVLQEESGILGDLTTSKFFKISEFPSVLSTGNSSFLIEGSDFLKNDIELKTELLDSAGNPIFHYAIPNYDKELPARRVAIEVYEDDIVNGVGSFTVLGELDPTKVEIPAAFQNTYNVRFSAPISINKSIKNTQPIRFYGDPTLSVSELVKGVIQPVYTGNQRTKTITGSISLNVSTPSTAEYGAEGSTIADTTTINEVGNNQSAYISQNVGEAQSSILGNSSVKSKPYLTYVVDAMEKGVDNDDNKITGNMKGATLTITSPNGLVDSSVYPDSDWTKPTTFSTKILDVINSTTFTTTNQYKIKNKKNNQQLVVPLQASASNASITHNVGSVVRTASQIFQRSYANMTVGNLRTFSGDTYKAKIYMKEDGSSGEFEKIYETLVESPNELIDQNSNSGFKSVGIFATQSIVDDFWVSSSNTFTATQDDDTLIDGILLSGSTEPNANSFTFETSQSYSLEKNEPYLVDFDLAFKPANKVQSDGTTKKDAKLEVFLTGTFLSETSQEVPLGEVELDEYDFNKINSFTKVKKKQVTDFLTHNIEGGVATGSLGFRVSAGEFILSDVRLRPFSETNFSPGFFKANVPMQPAIKRGQPYDFVVEFYDANNNLAEAVAVADDITFTGPRQVIGDGDDGILTGSVFLSNTEDTGIEFHGGSAYIRSVGYNGFNKALDSGGTGFMMFSGSVSKSLNTSESYEGVGLEIMDNSGANPSSSRFLKFRTNAEGEQSEFEIRTDNFLFGIEGVTNNYISGSNGNLEISSSNFQLKEDGDVTIEGTITAAVGGTIGGFDITTGSLAGADGHFFISGSASGSVDNFDHGNLFISSSGFQINSQGDIIARSGQIGRWDIDGDTLSSVNVHNKGIIIDADESTPIIKVLDDSDNRVDIYHTTSTNWGIKGISGSNTMFQLGYQNKIGGFTFTNNEISSSGLILKATGQISGAAVQMSGEINAETGTTAASLTAIGVATSSLNVRTGSLLTFTGSAETSFVAIGAATASLNEQSASFLAHSASMNSHSASVNTATGSIRTSLGHVGTATASLNVQSASFLAHSASMNTHTASANAASESMATQVKISSTGVDVQNELGGTISSFSTSAKFYGSASLSNTYAEVSEDGLTIISGSVTQSFFGDEVIIGDVDSGKSNIIINSGALKLRNNTTDIISIASDGTMTFGSDAATAISGSSSAISASAASANSSSIALTTQVVLDSGGMALKNAAANKTLADYGATTKIFDGENNNSYIEIGGGTIDFISGSVTGSSFSSSAAGFTASIFGAADKEERVEIVDTGMKVYKGDVQVSSFGSDVVVGEVANNKSNVQITSGALKFRNNADTIFSIAADGTFKFDSSDVRTLLSGSLGPNATNVRTLSATTVSGSSTSGSVAAMGTAATGVSASAAVTSDVADTRAQLVLDNSTANDQKINLVNSTGGIMSSFGKGVKFFGSASNALQTSSANTNYSEINPGGLIMVAASETASIFNSGGTTIMGGTATASLNADGLSLISAGVTASLLTATTSSMFGATSNDRTEVTSEGLKVYESNHQVASFGNTIRVGRADESHQTISSTQTQFLDGDGSTVRLQITNDGIIDLRDSGGNVKVQADTTGVKVLADNTTTFGLFNGTGITLVDNNVTGSLITATTSSMFGASSNDRVEVTATGMKVYESNKQMVNVGASGLEVFDTSNNQVAIFGSNTTLTGGTITLRSSDNNNDKLVITEDSLTISDNNNAVASFGANTILEGGTVTIRNTTNNNDKVVLGENSFVVYDNNTDVASFGAVTRIGDVANEHISASSAGITIKDGSKTSALFGATSKIFDQENANSYIEVGAGTIDIISGSVTASQFNSSGVVIGEIGNDKSRVEIASGGVKIVNRQSSTDTTMIEFNSDGDITSGDFLLERTRLFGAGNDGDVVLKSNNCTVSGGSGDAAKASSTSIKDENDGSVCTRSGAVWTMQGDWYCKSLEIDSSVAATTLVTNGYRLFVQGTLTVDSGCVIHNDGTAGTDGEDGGTDATNNAGGGAGGAGGSLAAGTTGADGGAGGSPTSGAEDGTNYGGEGGGGGGTGGIVFIAARTIVNNGTIRSHGGAGGAGGDGVGSGDSGTGSGPDAGGAGSAGSVIHIQV